MNLFAHWHKDVSVFCVFFFLLSVKLLYKFCIIVYTVSAVYTPTWYFVFWQVNNKPFRKKWIFRLFFPPSTPKKKQPLCQTTGIYYVERSDASAKGSRLNSRKKSTWSKTHFKPGWSLYSGETRTREGKHEAKGKKNWNLLLLQKQPWDEVSTHGRPVGSAGARYILGKTRLLIKMFHRAVKRVAI